MLIPKINKKHIGKVIKKIIYKFFRPICSGYLNKISSIIGNKNPIIKNCSKTEKLLNSSFNSSSFMFNNTRLIKLISIFDIVINKKNLIFFLKRLL
jgi:hypothetical protein